MTSFLEPVVYIAHKAGEVLKENFRKNIAVEHKGAIDLVTQMDKLSESIITDFLKEKFPNHQVLAEEGTCFSGDSQYQWLVDPLDGTTNYAHGIPWFAVSLGLFKNGMPYAGVVYNPVFNETFTAQKGKGAFLNGASIKVSQRSILRQCVLATGFPYYTAEKPHRVKEVLSRMLVSCRGVRRFGAAALDLAYVAAGIYDGFWEEGLKPWDTAAGLMLIEEAGGRITDYQGENYSLNKDTITASNDIIHQQILDKINGQVLE